MGTAPGVSLGRDPAAFALGMGCWSYHVLRPSKDRNDCRDISHHCDRKWIGVLAAVSSLIATFMELCGPY